MNVLLCLVFGLVLGALFYGGLLLTVLRIPVARRPGGLLLTSFLVRFALVGVGLFFMVRQGLGCLVAATAGFLLVRVLMTYPTLETGRPEARGGAGRERKTEA